MTQRHRGEGSLFVGIDFNCTENPSLDRNNPGPHASFRNSLSTVYMESYQKSLARLEGFYSFKHYVKVLKMETCELSLQRLRLHCCRVQWQHALNHWIQHCALMEPPGHDNSFLSTGQMNERKHEWRSLGYRARLQTNDPLQSLVQWLCRKLVTSALPLCDFTWPTTLWLSCFGPNHFHICFTGCILSRYCTENPRVPVRATLLYSCIFSPYSVFPLGGRLLWFVVTAPSPPGGPLWTLPFTADLVLSALSAAATLGSLSSSCFSVLNTDCNSNRLSIVRC